MTIPSGCDKVPGIRAPHWVVRITDRHRLTLQVEYDINIGTPQKPRPRPAVGPRIHCTVSRNEKPNSVRQIVIVSTQESRDPVEDIKTAKRYLARHFGIPESNILVLGEDISFEEWDPGYSSILPGDMNPGSVSYSPPH